MADNKPDSLRYLVLGRITTSAWCAWGVTRTAFSPITRSVSTSLMRFFLGKDVDDRRIKSYDVVKMRMHKQAGLLTLENIKSRDEADRLRNLYVMVAIEDAVGLEDDDFYLYQLIGLTVKTGRR